MSADELRDLLQRAAELIGPNVYLQALIIALAFIVVGKLADLVISGILGRIAKRSSNRLDDDFVALVHQPIFVSFVLIGLSLATAQINMPAAPEFITLGILKSIAVFVWARATLQLLALLARAISASGDSKLALSGMLSLLHNALKVVAVGLGGYFLFLAWNIDVTAWLASAGIVGLALSFAAKDTLSNLFAGISIIVDAPYKAGDFIILDSGERGVVTDIGLRSTRILTRDDIEITIPNGVIGNSKIINEAGGPPARHRIRIQVGVAYGSDIDDVIKVLEEVARAHAEILAHPAPRVRFRSFGDSSLDFELLGWIAQPVQRGRVTHELNCAVYKALQAHAIEIPFPQRDLHLRSVAEGLLPPRNA